jgi:hypothetical protein
LTYEIFYIKYFICKKYISLYILETKKLKKKGKVKITFVDKDAPLAVKEVLGAGTLEYPKDAKYVNLLFQDVHSILPPNLFQGKEWGPPNGVMNTTYTSKRKLLPSPSDFEGRGGFILSVSSCIVPLCFSYVKNTSYTPSPCIDILDQYKKFYLFMVSRAGYNIRGVFRHHICHIIFLIYEVSKDTTYKNNLLQL